MSAVDIYRYTDYRKFLAAFYRNKKNSKYGYSYRVFSRQAELKSPNHLKLVIDGTRNLTPKMTENYLRALRLAKPAENYFRALVRFNQAKSNDEKQKAYQTMLRSRGYRKAQRIDVAQADYHSKWYMPAIREVAVSPYFRDDHEWLAKQMIPPITPTEAKNALSLLFEMHFLERNDEGQISWSNPIVSTGAQTETLHIASYHTTMLQKTAEAIELVDAAERDISSLTLALSEANIALVKTRLSELRKELIGMATEEKVATRAVQIGLQLIPLSNDLSDDD